MGASIALVLSALILTSAPRQPAPVRISTAAASPATAATPDAPGTAGAGQAPAGGAGGTTPPPATRTASPPVHLTIARIGVDAPVVDTGLNTDGTVEVPPMDRPSEVGWYRGTPTPGQVGPAVLLGHIDTRQGPAVFNRLPQLRPGDRIDIRRQDGSTVSFQVRELHDYAKTAFPTELVYGNTPGPQLRLITCGGELGSDGHYKDNIIVMADPIS
ncbi:class F sortase [Kitasatospora nipponensis]